MVLEFKIFGGLRVRGYQHQHLDSSKRWQGKNDCSYVDAQNVVVRGVRAKER